jgi:PAS domain S-box-containing protein
MLTVAELKNQTENQIHKTPIGTEEEYQILVENGNDAIFIVQDGVYKFANRRACKMLNYTKGELEGKSLTQIVAPEDRKMAIERFRLRMSGKNKQHIFEEVLLTRDGRRVPVEVNASVINYRGRPADLAYARDMTEKKQMITELKESERKYRNLFENVKDVVYISNKEGRLIDINGYGVEFFGYSSKEEMFKIDIAKELYVKSSARKTFQRMIAEKGFLKDFEAKFKKKDGSQITVMITSTEIKNRDGKVIGYQGMIRDITEKKQREEEDKRRAKELVYLNRISSIVNRSLDLDKVLHMALKEMMKLIQAEKGFFFLPKDEKASYELAVSNGCGSKLSEEMGKLNLSQKVLPKEPVLVERGSASSALVRRFRPHSEEAPVVLVPLRVRNRCLGVIILILRKRMKTVPEGLRLVRLSASQIVGAFERAKLYHGIKEKERKLELLSNSIINMQEEERARISQELHDEISQALAAVEIETEMLRDKIRQKHDARDSFEKIKNLINDTLVNIRRISLHLRPVLLDELGLVSALRWYVSDFSQRTGIDVSIELKGIKNRVDQKREITIYRIVQECLTNVLKHSHATKTKIVLSNARNQIRMSIADNGNGFDTEEVLNKQGGNGGLGLFGIRERLRLMDGSLEVLSKQKKGTTVLVTVPV